MITGAHAHALRLGAMRDIAHGKRTLSENIMSIEGFHHFANHINNQGQVFYSIRAQGGGIVHMQEPRFSVQYLGSRLACCLYRDLLELERLIS